MIFQNKSFLSWGVVLILMFSAFFIRLENFKNSRARTIDEIVYYRIGKQLTHNVFNYNTIEYAKELSSEGRDLPGYFFEPLFKYPPLFSYLILVSMKLFGQMMLAAFYVPLVMGVVLIPLTYWLGVLCFGRKAGILAALLAYLDPVTIICSQKIWMETMLAALTLLSILYFMRGIKLGNSKLFLWCGFWCGMATLVKYPGILVIAGCSLYGFLYDKKLFRDPHFMIGMILPFLMLIPWIIWNLSVVPIDSYVGLHSSKLHQKETVVKFLYLLVVGALFRIYFIKIRNSNQTLSDNNNFLKKVKVVLGITLLILTSKNLWHALLLDYIPTSSWQSGMFYYEWPTFYFGRLIEFSPIFIFAIIELFIHSKSPLMRVLKLQSLIILGFYIFWGNYQSRYILAVIPLMIVLAVGGVWRCYERLNEIKNGPSRRVAKVILIGLLILGVLKILYINTVLSYPNDLCYF